VKLRGPIAAALAAAFIGATPRHAAPLTVYSAPAGQRPAGASQGHPQDAILPDGRIAAPLGATIFVGTNPQGIALTPDGRFAIVSNDEQDNAAPSALPRTAGAIMPGYSLAVIDTATMRIASAYQAPGASFFIGVAALRDPKNPAQTIVLASDGANNVVRVLDLAANGSLTAEPQSIPVPGFPATIDVALGGRVAYVAENVGDRVTAIDIADRRTLHDVEVGYAPFAAELDGNRLLVTNGGLARYRPLTQPAATPAFTNAAADEYRSSSLSVVQVDSYGDLTSDSPSVVRMDPVPDGVENVGGARPGALVVRRDGRFAYVALSNVDRVATLAVQGEPHVVAGLDLRLFVNAPYGSEPSAEVLSSDGNRLYVALAGLNAVAVLDARNPAKLHRLGLIPTGWYPSALALSPDGRFLYVADAKGVDGWGQVQRIDLKRLALVKSTLSALRYNRSVGLARENTIVPPLRSNRRSSAIAHVVCITVGSGTYDAIFGDQSASQTPNLRALASQYALADDFFVSDLNRDANLQTILGGPTLYAQQTLHVNAGRSPYDAHAQDPDDYARAGYIFNQLARAHLSFRDYGGLIDLSGYTPTLMTKRTTLTGLGGLYTLDVPALAALNNAVDLDYPAANPQIDDAARAAEFEHDMASLVAANQEPAFVYISLPAASAAEMADADRALGQIVGYLSRTPQWSSTAIFIMTQDTGNMPDRVNRARSFALVVSPLAKRGYVGHAHLSPASVMKTEEELLGLPPLALPELLSTDMADFFSTVPYPSPYQPIQ
jgi:DNA-binding beta-propeller fold protein YncE